MLNCVVHSAGGPGTLTQIVYMTRPLLGRASGLANERALLKESQEGGVIEIYHVLYVILRLFLTL